MFTLWLAFHMGERGTVFISLNTGLSLMFWDSWQLAKHNYGGVVCI